MLWSLDETALDLFARRPAKGFRTGLSFVDAVVSSMSSGVAAAGVADGFQPRQVVEICGSAATPKMLVLLHVIAAFVLKTMEDAGADAADGVERLEHANERVFLFDHEYEAKANQLLQILDAKLRQRLPDAKKRQVRSSTE